MTNHEADIPKPTEVISSLGVTNTGDIVIVTEGADGSYLTEDLGQTGGLNRAQEIFLGQQTLNVLFGAGEPQAGEVEDAEDTPLDLDEIRRQIIIAQQTKESDN